MLRTQPVKLIHTVLALTGLFGCVGADEDSGGPSLLPGTNQDAGPQGGAASGGGHSQGGGSVGGEHSGGGHSGGENAGGSATGGDGPPQGGENSGGSGSGGDEPPEGGSGGGGGGSGGGGGGGGAGGGFVPRDCGTGWGGDAKRWSLPFPIIGPATRAHTVFDLTGDGIVDLIISDVGVEPEDDPRIGRAYWNVYPGGVNGFANDPVHFGLPFDLDAIGEAGNLYGRHFTLLDMNADGRIDFVVHHPDGDPQGSALLGRSRWDVYLNEGDGFSEDPTPFTLPFSLRENGENSQPATRSHTVMDLDGDRLPDLVVHREGESPDDNPLLGRSHWLLYRNEGGGFSDAPVRFTLPYSLQVNGEDLSEPILRWHVLSPLRGPQGEFRQDFIQTSPDESEPRDARIGRAYWNLFENDGNGFSTDAAPFGLPFPLDEVNNVALGGFASASHSVFDLGGDGLPDLVVYRSGASPDEDGRLGRAFWLVYPSDGASFEGDAIRWTLPVPLANDQNDLASMPGTTGHGLYALKGECIDLVFYNDEELPDADPRIGQAYWLYYSHSP